MERWKRWALRLLYPPLPLALPLIILGLGGVFWVLGTGRNDTAVAYVFYLLSAYALALSIALIARLVRQSPAWFQRVAAPLHRVPVFHRWLSEREYRAGISLYFGLAINLVYAAMKGGMAVYYHSVWHGAVSIYYTVLSLLRLTLAARFRGRQKRDHLRQLRDYRATGWLLLGLNISMSGVLFQMVWQNRAYTYPGALIYASAAYTFYAVITATVNMVKYRGLDQPLLSAAKMISFVAAAMSLFSLQSAMIAQFGQDGAFRLRMGCITGTCVAVITLGVAGWMILRGHRAEKAAAEKDS